MCRYKQTYEANAATRVHTPTFSPEQNGRAAEMLTEDSMETLMRDGFVMIDNAIPQEHTAAVERNVHMIKHKGFLGEHENEQVW